MQNAYSATASALRATTSLGNRPIAPQLLEAAREELAGPTTSVEGRDTVDGLANRLVSEECLDLRIPFTQSRSYAQMDEAVCDQFSSIMLLVMDTVVRHFSDAGPSMEPKPDTNVLTVIYAMVILSDAKAFWSSVF